MADEARPPRPARRGAPPEQGWVFGASGLSKAQWGGITAALVALAVLLLALGYYGYGALVLCLAAAAGVNLW